MKIFQARKVNEPYMLVSQHIRIMICFVQNNWSGVVIISVKLVIDRKLLLCKSRKSNVVYLEEGLSV